MSEFHFFAETAKANLVEFYTITFILDNTLFAWADKKMVHQIVTNHMLGSRTPANKMFIRTREFYGAAIVGNYVSTGYSSPTKNDIPFENLRSMWVEDWA